MYRERWYSAIIKSTWRRTPEASIVTARKSSNAISANVRAGLIIEIMSCNFKQSCRKLLSTPRGIQRRGRERKYTNLSTRKDAETRLGTEIFFRLLPNFTSALPARHPTCSGFPSFVVSVLLTTSDLLCFPCQVRCTLRATSFHASVFTRFHCGAFGIACASSPVSIVGV